MGKVLNISVDREGGLEWDELLSTYVSEVDSGEGVTVTVESFLQANIEGVEVYFLSYGDEFRRQMKKKQVGTFQCWEVFVSFDDILPSKVFSYRFRITLNGSYLFLDAKGSYRYQVSNLGNFKYYLQSPVPDWLNDAVIYSVFVDRFKSIRQIDGNEMNSQLLECAVNDESFYFGGDLYGVVEKLDYLISIGVNTILLSPIFKSESNHRYDVIDYFVIDQRIGGLDAFSRLAEECYEKGIRIILDGVFNHCSNKNEWFAKAVSTENEINNEIGCFRNFFLFNECGGYESYWALDSLPKLNYSSEALRSRIFSDKDSVVVAWLMNFKAVYGWRLDAASMIGKSKLADLNEYVLKGIFKSAKSTDKDVYVFGEQPFDPVANSGFDTMDGITNYAGFYTPLLYWLDDEVAFDEFDLKNALVEYNSLVGFQFSASSINFIGNHDKRRMITLLDCDKRKYKTALAMLFTYVGVPAIYYGEEIALGSQSTANDSRIPMDWSGGDFEILEYTKALISLRKRLEPLRLGGFRVLNSSEGIFSFERRYRKKLVVVILFNRSSLVEECTLSAPVSIAAVCKKMQCIFGDVDSIKVDESGFLTIAGVKSCCPVILSSVKDL